MKFIERSLEKIIKKYLKPNKVVILLGARRVGKTELIKHILKDVKEKTMLLNGEDQDVHLILENRSIRNYKQILGDNKLLVIDEAQAIPEIGLKLKLMVDSIDGLKIIVTGSSVFDLNNQLGEPLVGRSYFVNMYPLAQIEFAKRENYIDTKGLLPTRLIYGAYPELEQLKSNEEKERYLKEQVNSYLLKDILTFEGIKKQNKIVSLLRLIAFRVGSEISIESIGKDLDLNKSTVSRYLDLLSKVFIIYNLSGFSRNLDNEITKKSKWYFFDNGIRNALINNFNPIELRDDQGKLWENYLVSERLKFQEYTRLHTANFFWRTHTQQEIDWVEDRGGVLYAYEFKWGINKKSKIPPLWGKSYPDSVFQTINIENYLDFITKK
ncbi:MAG: ATP-binding protein [Flavobacteriia bacterium]|nr:ATP-binding protein [Flavobacteriia bacterium]